jgi:hypothetical protein
MSRPHFRAIAPPEQKVGERASHHREPVGAQAVSEGSQEGLARTDPGQDQHAAQTGFDNAKAAGVRGRKARMPVAA